MSDRARPAAVVLAFVGALLLAGCGSSDRSSAPPSAGITIAPTQPGQPGAGTPLVQRNCTSQAGDAASMARALASARPGDRICLSGDMGGARLTLTNSGTPDQPITVLGGGRTSAGGITVEASNVAVDGVASEQPEAPGIVLAGNNISVTNNTVHRPHGGDGDGIRFWGSHLTIAHNTVTDTRGQNKRHADCMQTFATDAENKASQDVKIDGNRCERIDNICLIAEGPNSEEGDGSREGTSTRFEFVNNYCDNRADQAVFLDDVSDAVITGNQIVGNITKAFALQNKSTGAVIKDNRIGSSIGFEVGMDDSSQAGYHGPTPGGAP
jgi:Right handed beta helix region